MGMNELLSSEEEVALSKTIRLGFMAILKEIRKTNSESHELKQLKEKLLYWQKKDADLKPKNRHLKFISRKIDEITKNHPADRTLNQFCKKTGKHLQKIEVAKDAMIHGNLRLVIHVARNHMHQGLAFEDMIQEGNLGLMRAVYRFDYRLGNKFSTYATWWIKQAILRAIQDKTKTIRLPIHFLELQRQIHKTYGSLHKKLGRTPTIEELATYTNQPIEKIQNVLATPADAVSLDTPIGDDDTTLGDLVENEKITPADDQVIARELATRINSLLETLSKREAAIIRQRFGLGQSAEQTLEEIGEQFKVSRERIRQIEKKALNRLRHPARRELLKEFVA